jgi:hypothetical protein
MPTPDQVVVAVELDRCLKEFAEKTGWRVFALAAASGDVPDSILTVSGGDLSRRTVRAFLDAEPVASETIDLRGRA